MKLFFSLVLLLACLHPLEAQENQKEPLQVGFLLVDGVYNTEVMAPFDIFQHTIFHTQPGMEVFTVAPSKDPITTFEGLRILPDYTFDDPMLPDIDIFVVASAEHSMDIDLQDKTMIDFVGRIGANADFTISLCDGAFVLAQSGLVEGRESTTFPSDIPRYKEMFPKLKVHEGVSFVHDVNLITSAGGAKSYDAALYLCELLYGKKVAQGIGKGLVIDWQLDKVAHVKTKR